MLFVSLPSVNFSRSSVSTCAGLVVFFFCLGVQLVNTLKARDEKNVRGLEIFPRFLVSLVSSSSKHRQAGLEEISWVTAPLFSPFTGTVVLPFL